MPQLFSFPSWTNFKAVTPSLPEVETSRSYTGFSRRSLVTTFPPFEGVIVPMGDNVILAAVSVSYNLS